MDFYNLPVSVKTCQYEDCQHFSNEQWNMLKEPLQHQPSQNKEILQPKFQEGSICQNHCMLLIKNIYRNVLRRTWSFKECSECQPLGQAFHPLPKSISHRKPLFTACTCAEHVSYNGQMTNVKEMFLASEKYQYFQADVIKYITWVLQYYLSSF